MQKFGVFGLVFGLFWGALTGSFDYLVVSRMLQQKAAEQYPTVTGVISHSEMTQKRGSKGKTSYGIDLRYSYEVAGKKYESNRYRYDEDNSSDSRHARQVVGELSAGTKVPVYYNPNDPSDAVLSPGIGGNSLFMLLFLTPFNLIAVMFLSLPFVGKWARLKYPDSGGVRTWKEGTKHRARLTDAPALVTAAITLAGGAFLLTFIVAFSAGFHASMRTMTIVWAVLLGVTVSSFMWRRGRINSGREDLIFDETTGLISLPLTHGRKGAEVVSLPNVADIELRTKIRRGSKGRTSRAYEVHLQMATGESSSVTEFSDEDQARQFAQWLGQKLMKPVSPKTT